MGSIAPFKPRGPYQLREKKYTWTREDREQAVGANKAVSAKKPTKGRKPRLKRVRSDKLTPADWEAINESRESFTSPDWEKIVLFEYSGTRPISRNVVLKSKEPRRVHIDFKLFQKRVNKAFKEAELPFRICHKQTEGASLVKDRGITKGR